MLNQSSIVIKTLCVLLYYFIFQYINNMSGAHEKGKNKMLKKFKSDRAQGSVVYWNVSLIKKI